MVFYFNSYLKELLTNVSKFYVLQGVAAGHQICTCTLCCTYLKKGVALGSLLLILSEHLTWPRTCGISYCSHRPNYNVLYVEMSKLYPEFRGPTETSRKYR